MKNWSDFLTLHYRDDIFKLGDEWGPRRRTLFIDLGKLNKYPDLHEEALDKPDDAIRKIQAAVSILEPDIKTSMMSVAFFNHPERVTVRGLRNDDINKLVSIDGMFNVVGTISPRSNKLAFECASCGDIVMVKQRHMDLVKPQICKSCDRKTFNPRYDRSENGDAQYIKFQESNSGISIGVEPKAILGRLRDDMVDLKIVAGEAGNIVGIVRAAMRRIGRNPSPDYDMWIEIVHASVDAENYEDVVFDAKEEEAIKEFGRRENVFELLSDSLSPKTLGNQDVKDALTLQMFSSQPKIMPDGGTERGAMHVFIVGDPGVAKSQLLKAVYDVMPRCMYTSGEMSTTPGLLAGVVNDELGDGKQQALKAGAMALADGGLLIIDELDKLKSDVQGALHGALENQEISINKAGISKKLPARCPVLAAANPKHGRFDRSMSIVNQVNLVPALFSRFDLILPVFDVPNRDRDRKVGHRIGDSFRAAEHYRRGEELEVVEELTPPVDHAFMKRYILYARKNIFPLLTLEMQEILVDYYVSVRGYATDEDDPIPITARAQTSLFRLAEASARVRLSDTIEREDVERAVTMYDSFMNRMLRDPETGNVDADITELGASRSVMKRNNLVLNIIRQLGGETKPIDVLHIAKECDKIGISSKMLGKILESLVGYGDLVNWKGAYKIK